MSAPPTFTKVAPNPSQHDPSPYTQPDEWPSGGKRAALMFSMKTVLKVTFHSHTQQVGALVLTKSQALDLEPGI